MGYPSIDMIATGARIENLMRANNLSARQVADFMGFKAPQAVYKWLNGQSLPSIDNLLILTVILHTNMEGILVTSEDALPSFVWSGRIRLSMPAAA
jgi:transcriptional regulator with XRE-family HTH domain